MDMVGWYSGTVYTLLCGGMKLVIFNKQPTLQKVEEQNSRSFVNNRFQYNVTMYNTLRITAELLKPRTGGRSYFHTVSSKAGRTEIPSFKTY